MEGNARADEEKYISKICGVRIKDEYTSEAVADIESELSELPMTEDIGLAEYDADAGCWKLNEEQSNALKDYLGRVRSTTDPKQMRAVSITLQPTGYASEGFRTISGVPSYEEGPQ